MLYFLLNSKNKILKGEKTMNVLQNNVLSKKQYVEIMKENKTVKELAKKNGIKTIKMYAGEYKNKNVYYIQAI